MNYDFMKKSDSNEGNSYDFDDDYQDLNYDTKNNFKENQKGGNNETN